MEIYYSDFTAICGVDDPLTWTPGFEIKEDGIYIKIPDGNLTPKERASITQHPIGDLTQPALPFPCPFDDFKALMEKLGLDSSIDAFELAGCVEEKMAAKRWDGFVGKDNKYAMELDVAMQCYQAVSNMPEAENNPKPYCLTWIKEHHPKVYEKNRALERIANICNWNRWRNPDKQG